VQPVAFFNIFIGFAYSCSPESPHCLLVIPPCASVHSVTLEVLKDGKPPPDPKKANLLPGYTFGELALIQAGAAAYTVRVPSSVASGQDAAAVVAQVYCLSRFDFRNTVARQQAAKITEVKETLRQIELFEGLSDGNLVCTNADLSWRARERG